MKIADLIDQQLLHWLRYKGVNASSVSYSEVITVVEDCPESTVEVYYHLPNGDQGYRTFWGSLESFIDELDAVKGYL